MATTEQLVRRALGTTRPHFPTTAQTPEKLIASQKIRDFSASPSMGNCFPFTYSPIISLLLHRRHQERRMHGLEVQPLELIVPAGQVYHQHLGVAPFGGEHFPHGRDVLDAAHIGDQSPARPKPLKTNLA